MIRILDKNVIWHFISVLTVLRPTYDDHKGDVMMYSDSLPRSRTEVVRSFGAKF